MAGDAQQCQAAADAGGGGSGALPMAVAAQQQLDVAEQCNAGDAAARDCGGGGGGGGGKGLTGLLGKWGAVTSSVYRSAAEGWLNLPPQQDSLAFLRLASVLLRLSSLVYDVDEGHVGQAVGHEVPLAGRAGDCARVTSTLVEFRGAVQGEGLSSPEQFGVWEVEGVGLVVAFRGTASTEDVLVDVNIRPAPLATTRNMRGVQQLQVHQGFYNGVRRHLPAVAELIAARAKAAPESLLPPDRRGKGSRKKRWPPVWITGHSLGGGYANCVMLHLLANRSCGELFGGGGGSVTFGAPMVLYGEDAPKLYASLQKLEEAAEAAAGKAGHPPLHFHNFVCGSDIVPRLLGASLSTVHDSVADYWKVFGRLTSAMTATSQQYHPFGTYHFILGKEVRTPRHGSAASSGGVGDAEYAAKIAAQLDVNAAMKAILRGAASSPAHDHFLNAYEAGLRATMDTMAADAEADKGEDAAEPSTLFLLPEPSAADPIAAALDPDAHVDALGRTIGQAGWTVASAAAGFAGRAAVEYMKQPRKPKADAGAGQPQAAAAADAGNGDAGGTTDGGGGASSASWGSWLRRK